MIKSCILSVTICVYVMLMFPVNSYSELTGGKWIHHERQAPQNDITAIFPGTEYKIWASTGNTLHAYDGTYWKKFSFDDQSLYDHTPFFRDEKGRFFFNDGSDLAVLEDGIISRFDDEKLHYPINAAADGDGTVYMGLYDIITGGVYVFNGSSVKKVRDGRVRSVTVDDTGRVWATIRDPENDSMGLFTLDGEEWTDRSGEIGELLPAETYELTVQATPDGSVWVNNLGNYGIYKNNEWIFHDGGSGPMYLSFDSSGGVWGYKSKNLYKLDDTENWVISRKMGKGMPDRQNFIAEDADNAVWCFDSYRAYSYIDSDWIEGKNDFDLISDTITCAVYTEDGKLMCGHGLRSVPLIDKENNGISVWDGSTWSNFNYADDTYLYNVYFLKKSPYNEIIAETDHGLKIFDGTTWATVDTLEALKIADVAWDDSAIMWVASYNGLLEYNYPEVEFNVHPRELNPQKVFYNLNFDSEGMLYMQTNFGSIVTLYGDREEEWKSHPSNSINSSDIAIDNNDVLWCARQNFLSWWDIYDGWMNATDLNNGKMVEVDDQGRIWASGLGTTGYLEDGVWHDIPELSHSASDMFATDGKGRYALNSFNLNIDLEPPPRTDSYGLYEYVPVTVHVEQEEKPKPFMTSGNYPNPFNASTTIHFRLTEPGSVTVTVFNIHGQKVKTIASEFYPAGLSSVMWDSTSESGAVSASGIYFYRIEAGGMMQAGKVLLLR